MIINITGIVQSLILLLAANGAPIVTGKLCGNRFSCPIDFSKKGSDGRVLFGRSKTWRGFLGAMLFASGIACLLGFAPVLGALFGLATMMGDLLASFCKRRMGLPESSRARGLDTVPESLLPVLLFKTDLGLGWPDVLLTVICFFLIEEYISPILYRLHIRKKPY